MNVINIVEDESGDSERSKIIETARWFDLSLEAGVLTTNIRNETVAVMSWGNDADDREARICSWESP